MKVKLVLRSGLEESKKKSDGVSKEDRQNITKFVGDERAFFTMSNVGRLGVYPMSGFSTPVGLYCYQLDADHFFALKRSEINAELSKLRVSLDNAIDRRNREEFKKYKKVAKKNYREI